MSSLLPPNATAQERALAEAAMKLLDIPVPIKTLWDPDTCAAAMLPWLAWSFSLDEWDDNWTDSQKRNAIKSGMTVHRQKGTIGSVKRALAAVGVSAKVQEWFNQSPAGDPYTFKLLLGVSQESLTVRDLQYILSLVDASKNVRSHLSATQITVSSRAESFVAAASLLGSDMSISYGGPTVAINNMTLVG